MKTMSKLVLLAAAGWAGVAAASDSLCASVKIEIEQELTLERQAFDAKTSHPTPRCSPCAELGSYFDIGQIAIVGRVRF